MVSEWDFQIQVDVEEVLNMKFSWTVSEKQEKPNFRLKLKQAEPTSFRI